MARDGAGIRAGVDGAGSNASSRLRNAAIEQPRPTSLALTGCSPIQSSAAGTLLLVAHALGGEGGVQFAPASRLPNDRRGIVERDPLSAPLAGSLLQVLGSPRRSTFALVPRPEPFGATIRVHGTKTARFAFPPLTLLDAGDRTGATSRSNPLFSQTARWRWRASGSGSTARCSCAWTRRGSGW